MIRTPKTFPFSEIHKKCSIITEQNIPLKLLHCKALTEIESSGSLT